ncbi:MAG: RimJ/RimL family protein N-acetyltransferase [Nocardioidaceae bacterium]|nr:RimJ/RimL family protein N-acetyltransferase [Nocardioidaceae bacterium]
MRDSAAWHRLRQGNAEWLSPWEATLPVGDERPITSYRQMVRALRRQGRQGRTLPFLITYENQVVGQLTVNGITWGSARWANIGYWISESHAGLSITPTAVAVVCDHLFATMGLHRIEIAIRPENAASLRIVEKLGFSQYGVAPKYLHIAGEWADHRLFQLVAEDVRGSVLSRLDK